MQNNNRPRVLITSPWFSPALLNRLEENFDVRANHMERWFTEDELCSIIGEFDAVIAGLDPFTSRVLENASNLKLIARRGIGFDTIDLLTCKRMGVKVTNTPVQEEETAVAEFTFSLILNLTRNISRSSYSLKSGSWQREKYLGKGIGEITVGILGLGHIGSRVAELVHKMGGLVIYYDPYVNSKTFRKANLTELFKESDIVSIHAPKTQETINMINREHFSLMKKGSHLINTSRAEIINMHDLEWAVNNGTIASVALDVFAKEPPEIDDFLISDNVLVTPHIAAFTEKSFSKIDEICCNNVEKVILNGVEPDYRIV
ncbi:MAG: hypothetical protein B2I17_06470 [Thermoplasmatales archaeon B_DKE]|nr:MAG: hypothetical protein B2I17_06470 [Thermoplasmatales archaeon B_DKE]